MPEYTHEHLARAVERHEIEPRFQPQIDLSTGVIVAVELLARWRSAEFGLVQPASFIPVAEDGGQINDIGAFMLDESTRCATALRDCGLEFGVSVNVSAVQLDDEHVFTRFMQLVDDAGLDHAGLTVELTESRAFADPQLAASRLRVLADAGFGISIDDFGTGVTSLNQLDIVPATELKIDRSLVQAGAHDAALADAVRAGHDRGLRIVAEGVETPEQAELVAALGCDRAQGYLYSRPVTFDELIALVANDQSTA